MRLILGFLAFFQFLNAQTGAYADLSVQVSHVGVTNGRNNYRVLVTNAGSQAFTTATVRVVGLTTATGGVATTSSGSYSNGVWQIGALGLGQTVQLSVNGTTVGSMCAQLIQSNPLDRNSRNNASCANAQFAQRRSDLAVTINALPAPCLPGGTCPTAYTITLQNVGTIDVGNSIVQVSGVFGGVSGTPSVGTFSSNVWRIPTNLAVGQSATLTFQYASAPTIANPPAVCGTLIFSSPTDGNASNNRACSAVTPPVPQQADLALSLVSVLRPPNPLIADEPACIDHTFTLRNNGPAASSSATIQLNAVNYLGQIYTNGTASQGSFGNGTWQVGTPIQSGQTATLQVAQCYGGYFYCEPSPGCYQLYNPVPICGEITQTGITDPVNSNNRICDTTSNISTTPPSVDRAWQGGDDLISAPASGNRLTISDGCSSYSEFIGQVPLYGSFSLSGTLSLRSVFENVASTTVPATFVGSIANGNISGTLTAQLTPTFITQVQGTPATVALGCPILPGIFSNSNYQATVPNSGGCSTTGFVLTLTPNGGTIEGGLGGALSQPLSLNAAGGFSVPGTYGGNPVTYSGSLVGTTMNLVSPIQIVLQGGVLAPVGMVCP